MSTWGVLLLLSPALAVYDYTLVHTGGECDGTDYALGTGMTLDECAAACAEASGCEYFIFGTGSLAGKCYHEANDCSSFNTYEYDAYQLDVKDFVVITSDQPYSDTDASVSVKFEVDGAWTAGRHLFTGTTQGTTHTLKVALEGWPTRLQFYYSDSSASSFQNAWGYWKVTWGCWTLLEDPNGSTGTPYPTAAVELLRPWWIDGEDAAAVVAPDQVTVLIPPSGTACGGYGTWSTQAATGCDTTTCGLSIGGSGTDGLVLCSGGADSVCPAADKPDADQCAATSACTSSSSSSVGDPHLYFAHGGRADFRGLHGKTYAMLSAPGFSLAMTTRDADFELPRQLVHGSFFTEAFFTLRPQESDELVMVYANASKEGLRFSVNVNGKDKHFGRHRLWNYKGLRVECKEVKLIVTAGDWEVTLLRRHIRKPLGDIKYRYDTQLKLLTEEENLVVAPHGILGQSYDGDNVAVDGKLDLYHGAGAEFTTSSMAEGAIEGVAADYIINDPVFETAFKYSRFDVTEPTGPRDVSKLGGYKHKIEGPRGVTAGTNEEVEA